MINSRERLQQPRSPKFFSKFCLSEVPLETIDAYVHPNETEVCSNVRHTAQHAEGVSLALICSLHDWAASSFIPELNHSCVAATLASAHKKDGLGRGFCEAV
jgi:hypothetical protein